MPPFDRYVVFVDILQGNAQSREAAGLRPVREYHPGAEKLRRVAVHPVRHIGHQAERPKAAVAYTRVRSVQSMQTTSVDKSQRVPLSYQPDIASVRRTACDA